MHRSCCNRLWLAILFLLLCPIDSEQATAGGPLLWGDLQPGPYAVGFRVLYERDKAGKWSTQTGKKDGLSAAGRPIRISIWYPAVADERSHGMKYGDYFHYDGPRDFREVNTRLEKNDRQSWLDDLKEVSPRGGELFSQLCATPVAAVRDARPVVGLFPLLLYSGGLGSRADANVELGEYLASHGYIVATIPQLGPSLDEIQLPKSNNMTELHVSDFEFALRILRTVPNVDAERLAFIGHSLGGVVALDFAMQNPAVKVVVGLDGSYGFAGAAAQIDALPGYAPRQLTACILDLRRANGVQGAKVDLTVLEQLTSSDRYLITFTKMFHGDFTEFAPIALKLSVPLPPNTDGRTRETGYEGNQYAYRAILNFLNAKLMGKPEAMDALFSGIRRLKGTTILNKPPRVSSKRAVDRGCL